jgi:HEAT repeat protein
MKSHTLNRFLVCALIAMLVAAVGCSTSKSAGLKSKETLVRKATLAKLAESPDMAYFDDLIHILQNDPDRIVRSQAALTLAKYSERYYSVAYAPLSDALRSDPSVFVRSASAASLSVTRDSRAVAPLIESLRDTDRGEVTVNEGKRAVTYKACAADAARTSLEKIVGMKYESAGASATAKAQRIDLARQWEDWYDPRAGHFPSGTAVAKQ